MPNGGGFELIEEIRGRSFEEGGLTPALAMTAGSDSESEALLRGFHCWFSKPIDLLKLLDAIRSCAAARSPTERAASARATVTSPRDGALVVTLVGHTRLVDVHILTRAIRAHLERGPHRIITDLRRHTGVDFAAPWAAQKDLWNERHEITGVHFVGGTLRVQMIGRASCALLKVPCTFGTAMPDDLA